METETGRRRLAEFVDRTDEMERFCQMLESDEKHIMVVWGEPGMGKTSLRMRMVHECAQRKLRKAEVECGAMRTSGYLAIMRKIREDLGPDYFAAFSDYAEYLTKPGYQPQISVNVMGNIAVAQQAQISGKAGDIAGVVIKDSMIVMPRTDIAVPEEERMMVSTDRFINGLGAALKEGKLIVFLDAVEKMASNTERWLWEELLLPVREGQLTGVKFVLCAEKQPQLDRDWRAIVEEAQLSPLALEHIKFYLERRGVEEALREGLAIYLLANTKGKISLIAEGVDAFVAMKEKMTKQ